MSTFRLLTRLFLDRFHASEELADGTGFEANVYAIMALLATFQIAFCPLGPLFLIALAFGITGLATTFEWEMLFPDRRDFLVLTPLPLRVRHVFTAKLTSLAFFLSQIVAALHAYTPFVLMGFLSDKHVTLGAALLQLAALVAGTASAAAFGFFSVTACQGLWVNLLTPRFYVRLSPWLQTLSMGVMVLAILLYPVYFLAVALFPKGHADWVWWIPPYWFQGVAELFSAKPRVGYEALGRFGLKALGASFAVFAVTWAAAYMRQSRRTLEALEGAEPTRRSSPPIFEALLGTNVARAIFRFTGKTLARSLKHRLFFVCYLSTGISLGVFVSVRVTRSGIGVSDDGLRTFSPLLIFCAVSAFRAAFQFPVELRANLMFRLAQSGWGEAARDAARLRVAVSGLLPMLLATAPLEIGQWGVGVGLFHVAFLGVSGMLLTEVLFYSFDKIPFTCSYYPGGLNLIVLAVAYFYGFTTYSFEMADLEKWLEVRPWAAGLFLTGGVAIWIAVRQLHPGRTREIKFEGGDPEFQSLELT